MGFWCFRSLGFGVSGLRVSDFRVYPFRVLGFMDKWLGVDGFRVFRVSGLGAGWWEFVANMRAGLPSGPKPQTLNPKRLDSGGQRCRIELADEPRHLH